MDYITEYRLLLNLFKLKIEMCILNLSFVDLVFEGSELFQELFCYDHRLSGDLSFIVCGNLPFLFYPLELFLSIYKCSFLRYTVLSLCVLQKFFKQCDLVQGLFICTDFRNRHAVFLDS